MTVNELIHKLTKYPGNMVVKSRHKVYPDDFTDIILCELKGELLILGVGQYHDEFDGLDGYEEIHEENPDKIYLV